jgi:hypothetical protein
MLRVGNQNAASVSARATFDEKRSSAATMGDAARQHEPVRTKR